MNKKMIAVAVASALAAPAVYADITPYGRINNAIDVNDTSDGNNVDLSGISSRFGFKGSGDIGNGMTAIGRYEFSTVTDKEQPNVNDLRLGYVGLSGGFGTVTAGNQWSAYYNSIGTFLSPTYTLGYYLYSSIVGGPFRASNTIKYANSFGPVNLEIDVRLNDSDEGGDVAEKLNGNGYGIGLTFNPMDNLTIALAADKDEDEPFVDDTGVAINPDDQERAGIVVNYDFGPVAANLGYQEYKEGDEKNEHVQAHFSGPIGEKTTWLLGWGEAKLKGPVGGDKKPSQVTLGLYHNMGGGLRLWSEYVDLDRDDGGDKTKRWLLGMRIDF
jgi:predicted porin